MKNHSCKEVVVIDFETTGSSADYSRIIEVGAVVVKDDSIIESFSQLMNPGIYVPYEITALTGITNGMLQGMPRPQKVMPELKKFIGNRVILAHNASFDGRFLQAEMKRAGLAIANPIICTLLLSRRLIPDVCDYKLGSLARHLDIKMVNAHRALDDVNATAKIWEHLYKSVIKSTGILDPDSDIFSCICNTSKKMLESYFQKLRSESEPSFC